MGDMQGTFLIQFTPSEDFSSGLLHDAEELEALLQNMQTSRNRLYSSGLAGQFADVLQDRIHRVSQEISLTRQQTESQGRNLKIIIEKARQLDMELAAKWRADLQTYQEIGIGAPAPRHQYVDGGIFDQDGRRINGPVSRVFIPGITTDEERFKYLLELMGDAGYHGIYNQSDGFIEDLLQAAGDRLSTKYSIFQTTNPAVISLKEQIIDAIENGRPLEIVAHSQGGAIASAAFRAALLEGGYSSSDLQNITLITYGSAGTMFPTGLNQTHYMGLNDAVRWGIEVGETLIPNPDGQYDANLKILWGVGHGFEDYLKATNFPSSGSEIL